MADDIRLAVCDDEPAEQAEMAKLLRAYPGAGQLCVRQYQDVEAFLKENREYPFDIVLMDIEMSTSSGFEAAKKLKQMEKAPLVIFATKSQDYAIRGYGIAHRYLVKPIQPDTLAEALDSAVEECRASRLVFKIDGRKRVIPIQEICFIESFGHSVSVFTENDELKLHLTLAEVMQKLPQTRFASPHRSYLVNLEKVAACDSAEVTLVNGASISLSRYRRQDFDTAFNRFLDR